MINFPSTFTAIPRCPGYFWCTKTHKVFSIKVGGILRELKQQSLHGYVSQKYFAGRRSGDKFYVLSVNGQKRYKFVDDLMDLELKDYDIPVVTR